MNPQSAGMLLLFEHLEARLALLKPSPLLFGAALRCLAHLLVAHGVRIVEGGEKERRDDAEVREREDDEEGGAQIGEVLVERTVDEAAAGDADDEGEEDVGTARAKARRSSASAFERQCFAMSASRTAASNRASLPAARTACRAEWNGASRMPD